MALRDVIRFRTTRTFKRRFNRLAALAKQEPSEHGRQVLTQYVERRERELQAEIAALPEIKPY